MRDSPAPIVLFTYNRPNHTKNVLRALSKNVLASGSPLYVFHDGLAENHKQKSTDDHQKLIQFLREFRWMGGAKIVFRERNFGLAKNIREGVTSVIQEYGKVIVLEDDIVTSPGFLSYMNSALELYEGEKRVMHVSGYMPETSHPKGLPETFFLSFMSCWGWATWADRWEKANWDAIDLMNKVKNLRRELDLDGTISQFQQLERNVSGELNTWAVMWYTSIFLSDGLCLYPHQSLVQNIGFDGTGVHKVMLDSSTATLPLADNVKVFRQEVIESKKGRRYLKNFYQYGKDSSTVNRARIKAYKIKQRMMKLFR